MKGERTKLATLKSAVADIDDATRFPNIAKARAHYASLPAERRVQLEQEWEYI
mgnify:FL=1